MYGAGESAIFLTANQESQYQTTLRRLLDELGSNEELSKSTISNALQNAIFESLDIQGRRSADFSARLDKAMDDLARLALLPVQDYECFIEVAGLDQESLPARFGTVRFVIFNRYQSRRLQLDPLVRVLAPDMMDSCFGVVKVHARDGKAAIALASRIVRSTVDCLNFFVDMIPYNHGWVFLRGDREQRTTAAIAIEPDGTCYSSVSRTEPLGHFSMIKLRKTQSTHGLVKSVSLLLRTKRSETEELLLTVVQIAGRATIARRPEESFLLFAVALESLILPRNGQELTRRLSQRIARLLIKDVTKRVEHSKEVRRLYGIRSRIVHSGSYEIDASDLNSIRMYTKGVIALMLSHARVRRCTTRGRLNDWLERLELQ